MKTRFPTPWLLRLVTFTAWMLALLSCGYWAMKFVTVAPVKAATALQSATPVPDSKVISKLLGATDSIASQATNTSANSNYALFGVISYGLKTGVALIAADNKPARPYRVGSKVADDWVLKSVSRTQAVLASSMAAPDGIKLELPARRPASVMVIAPLAGVTPQPPVPALATTAAPTTPTAAPATSQSSPVQAALLGMASASTAAVAPSPNTAPNAALTPQSLRPSSRFAPEKLGDAPREVPRIPLPASAQP